MAKTKSDRFRELYDEGHAIAEIARMTGDYYSFVYRVIKRYEKTKEENSSGTPDESNRRLSSGTQAVRDLVRDGCNVDEVLNQLGLPEEKRGAVYRIWMKENGK